jgi:hypothetical protein
VSDLYISAIGMPILLEEICRPIVGLYNMHVEIGAEAALLPEKEYISGIFVAVQYTYSDNNTEKQNLTNRKETQLRTLQW